MARTSKTENKTAAEKVKQTPTLSPKRQLEADHLAGKHGNTQVASCGYCERGVKRTARKDEATKRYFAGHKK